MKEIRFNICDEVFFLNTATWAVDKGMVKGIQVVPVGISRDAEGKEVLDGDRVLYALKDGGVVTDAEAFANADEVKKRVRELVVEWDGVEVQ